MTDSTSFSNYCIATGEVMARFDYTLLFEWLCVNKSTKGATLLAALFYSAGVFCLDLTKLTME